MPEYIVYEPDEDTFLLADTLKKELGLYIANTGKALEFIRFLEMGAGSGYIGFSAENEGLKKPVLVDSNSSAIELMQKQKEETRSDAILIHSDLFTAVPHEEFDIIVFNTPYLPNDETVHDPSLHGGPLGNELALQFLAQAQDYLAQGGFILLLTSSLAHPEGIEEYCDNNNFICISVAKLKLFFEELIIYKIVKK
jgi:release factor glutamine methyltransferase